ncbi:hypothetical protein LX36DRAFT_675510 [Colletotrichum falcatum]|nr:hypothetical protein LX36DRAFT_675510 [Colletotrichum falcatum]
MSLNILYINLRYYLYYLSYYLYPFYYNKFIISIVLKNRKEILVFIPLLYYKLNKYNFISYNKNDYKSFILIILFINNNTTKYFTLLSKNEKKFTFNLYLFYRGLAKKGYFKYILFIKYLFIVF